MPATGRSLLHRHARRTAVLSDHSAVVLVVETFGIAVLPTKSTADRVDAHRTDAESTAGRVNPGCRAWPARAGFAR